jgi:hypothetical protein
VNVTFDDVLGDPARRDRLFGDCARLIEEEVRSKRGLGGIALRAGFAAFQRVQPGILPLAVERLVPDMARAIEPHWTAVRGSPEPVGSLVARARGVADDLLRVTDRWAERTRRPGVASIYRSLRPAALDHVTASVPRLAALLHVHLG